MGQEPWEGSGTYPAKINPSTPLPLGSISNLGPARFSATVYDFHTINSLFFITITVQVMCSTTVLGFFQVHRVIIPNGELKQKTPRRSIAFFYDPDWKARIACLDGSNKYPSIKCGKYVTQVMSGSFSFWKAGAKRVSPSEFSIIIIIISIYHIVSVSFK